MSMVGSQKLVILNSRLRRGPWLLRYRSENLKGRNLGMNLCKSMRHPMSSIGIVREIMVDHTEITAMRVHEKKRKSEKKTMEASETAFTKKR